jgi:hypothetical protein
MVHLQSQPELMEIVSTHGSIGCGSRTLDSWKDQTHQHGDDSEDDE